MTRQSTDRDLDRYTSLMETFVSGAMDGETFEKRYYAVFKSDETSHDEDVFAALDDVFWAADAFYADPERRDPGDLDEDQLRERVRAALTALQKLPAPV